MKKVILLILAACIVILFCACDQPDPIITGVGEFQSSHEFVSSIGSEEDGSLKTAADGNTFLLIYLTPVDGTEVDLDAADVYFRSGARAVVDTDTYDLLYLAYDEVNDAYVRCVLIFEVADNGYSDGSAQPTVSLDLP
ncbi:MAG: hypothetical protein PHO15_09890 [Eubacteriales bacterium]|nr:hypothetical protein [Eubacteriales bacterium]